ncbi:WLM domain-containing protein [Multifurca ochricompacta]|uniref:WLM domain-containing protein n=1 Tax=Multifurca ochricompacta TaxID=376703 RepID=A0AAD4M6P1_9AGAM|nr:WLM domain-containing protein [Multifurca ochricompacta]
MSTDIWVLSYEHLKGHPRSDHALLLLQKVASRVKPIMRKHGWRLPVLAEFFPDFPNLLDINMGQKILLHIVYTLLHELTHNVHGPHDQSFYKFLSGLEEEYYELKRSGYAGEGFFSNGRQLGGGIPQTLPTYLARQRALEAAERRRRANVATGTAGPVKLGGGNLADLGLTPRELAVLAADMRAIDEKKCASGTVAQQEAEKAARDSHHNKATELADDFNIDGFDYADDFILDDEGPSSPSHGSYSTDTRSSSHNRPSSSRSRETRLPPDINVSTRPRPPPINNMSKPVVGSSWTCPTCTLINNPFALQCDACRAARPLPQQAPSSAASTGWTCGVCGEEGIEHKFWTCRFCGSVKTESTFG